MIESTPLLNVDASTLKNSPGDYDQIGTLYKKYHDELVTLCHEMAILRKRMLEQGYSADFSDRESEILYLLLREIKPEVVVEVSPCHGYSTNYILAAITKNQKGACYSFEIEEEFQGKVIPDIIRGNLHASADQSRLHISIGDAMQANIPSCDFLFIDSCHEAYFAAWYVSHLIERARFVFVHDLLLYRRDYRAIIPKAAFLGIREQYYLLETLALNNQSLFSVAECNACLSGEMRSRLGRLPVRNEGAAERIIFFQGFSLNETSKALNEEQAFIHQIEQWILMGNRNQALQSIQNMITGNHHLFSRLQAYLLLPKMGYRWPASKEVFSDVRVHYEQLTISQLVCLLEGMLTSCNFTSLSQGLREIHRAPLHPGTLQYILHNYRAMSATGYRRHWHMLIRLLKEIRGRQVKG